TEATGITQTYPGGASQFLWWFCKDRQRRPCQRSTPRLLNRPPNLHAINAGTAAQARFSFWGRILVACFLFGRQRILSGGKVMWKKAFVGAAALMIAGSIIVYAQQGSETPIVSVNKGAFTDSRVGEPHAGLKLNAEDMAAFSDARIAGLHAGLKLNTDQEKTWPALEQALRDLAKMRIDRLAVARDLQPSSDPVQRLQRRADAL